MEFSLFVFLAEKILEPIIMHLVFQFLILGQEMKSEFGKYILGQYFKFVLGSPFDFCENTENVCLENSRTFVYIVYLFCFILCEATPRFIARTLYFHNSYY